MQTNNISKLLVVVFLLDGAHLLTSPCSGFLPFLMNFVSFLLAQFSLLLPSLLKEFASSHIVLVGVHLKQVLPFVKDHLVQNEFVSNCKCICSKLQIVFV